MNSDRDQILARVKSSLRHPSQLQSSPANVEGGIAAGLESVTPPDAEGLYAQFKKEIELISGEYRRVKDEKEAALILRQMLQKINVDELALDGSMPSQQISRELLKLDAGMKIIEPAKMPYADRRKALAGTTAALVTADYGLSDTAGLVVFSDGGTSDMAHFLPLFVFTVLPADRLLPNMFELFKVIDSEKAKKMVFITGPSRTADIEKVVILGAHGPARLIVFLMGDRAE